MRVGEIRQFCKLQDEGAVLSLSKYQSLMRADKSQLNMYVRRNVLRNIVLWVCAHLPLTNRGFDKKQPFMELATRNQYGANYYGGKRRKTTKN